MMSIQQIITTKVAPLTHLYLSVLFILLSLPANETKASNKSKPAHLKHSSQLNNCQSPNRVKKPPSIPDRKASRGNWLAEIKNPTSHIILSAGHVNRISGTTGYNNPSLIDFQGHKHTTEAALTKIITPFMVKVGRKRGFSIEQFQAESTSFKEATLELAHYERVVNGIAFEIHSDAPSEGHHRAPGYNGQTGIIPPVNSTITKAESCAGNYMGKFKKGMRGLYAPKQGISLFELFPTNRTITQAVHRAVRTGNYTRVEQLTRPYIDLFFDALEQGGIAPSSTIDRASL